MVAFCLNGDGLPQWSSGWASTCQCKGHKFNPWSRRIPHATGHLSPCTTTTWPELANWCSATREATAMRAHAPQLENSPNSPQLEKAQGSNQDPVQWKVNIFLKNGRWIKSLYSKDIYRHTITFLESEYDFHPKRQEDFPLSQTFLFLNLSQAKKIITYHCLETSLHVCWILTMYKVYRAEKGSKDRLSTFTDWDLSPAEKPSVLAK